MTGPEASSRLEVGRIDKAHGLRGEVVVSLTTNRHERVQPGAILHAGDRALAVGSSRPHGHRFLVSFEGVAGREEAEELRGQVLTADPIDDPEELWVHELLGVEVVTPDGGSVGTVEAVLDNPASDLLVLDGGALVPANFVVGFDGTTLVIDPPPGLFDV